MDLFSKLFSASPKNIKTKVIITPFLYKGISSDLKLGAFKHGEQFWTAQSKDFTFIFTYPGAYNVGDAVLYLKETKAQDIVYYGACGLIKDRPNLRVGSIAVVKKAYNCESFTSLVNSEIERPAKIKLPKQNPFAKDFIPISIASFGSIKLEKDYRPILAKYKIDGIDLETTSFYSACRKIKRIGTALLYSTDIIGREHPWFTFDKNKDIIRTSQIKLTQILLKWAKSL
jgi:hypothetical protein